ncbi:hypothetical protein DICVIV_09713 [Dictyocaulus viviparus]|uniref:GOLD domain-containing protein n=1 Tax=Dictyocaulus viviparus TaxID=29172 RepID=A0A0D8XI42_DICVI|nr:hypothetical protein DICVIV_09713 [Dictyocaulus viviparus]
MIAFMRYVLTISLLSLSTSKAMHCFGNQSELPDAENHEVCLEVSYNEFRARGYADCSIHEFVVGFGDFKSKFRGIKNKESGLCMVRKMNETDFVKNLAVAAKIENERRMNESLENYERQSKVLLDNAKLHLLLLATGMTLTMGTQLIALRLFRKKLHDHYNESAYRQQYGSDGDGTVSPIRQSKSPSKSASKSTGSDAVDFYMIKQ